MLNHQPDQLAVAELFLRQPKLLVNRLTLPQKLSRLQIHLANQFSEFLSSQRSNIIIHFLKRNAALPEQLVHLATFRSSRFFVNSDLVCHSSYGNIPLTLVASTT